MMTTDYVRQYEEASLVNALATTMQHQLKENRNKGGWRDEEVWVLFGRLCHEVEELRDVLLTGDYIAVWLEAADVANFAAMIADTHQANQEEER
jgi:hypothetical protein